MNFLLAKLYLFIICTILIISSIFLITQIILKQKLEKTLVKLQSTKYFKNNFKLGQIYLRKNIYNKAIDEFRLSFQNWEKEDRLGLASLFNTLGFTYYKLKEYEIATYYYKIAIQLTPDYLTCLINLAYIYQIQNRLTKLQNILNQIYKYDPNNKKIKELQNYLNKRL